jgi:hypothetical protein
MVGKEGSATFVDKDAPDGMCTSAMPRSTFRDGLVRSIVLVLSLTGTVSATKFCGTAAFLADGIVLPISAVAWMLIGVTAAVFLHIALWVGQLSVWHSNEQYDSIPQLLQT